MKYPFKEGEDYYTIEQNEVVSSFWDFVSEEMHTEESKYYKTSLEANVNLMYDYVIDNLEYNHKKENLIHIMDKVIKEINHIK